MREGYGKRMAVIVPTPLFSTPPPHARICRLLPWKLLEVESLAMLFVQDLS